MAAVGFTLFDTAVGPCAIAWSARGIVAVGLPEASEAATKARLKRAFPDAEEQAPPPEVQHAVERIAALLEGGDDDLADISLDLDRVPDFNRQVYEIARTIRPGETLNYGAIAERLGDRTLAQSVGQALGRNPFPIIVPCHRVLAAGGKAGGFSAHGGLATKRRLLAIESVHAVSDEPDLFRR